MTNQVDKKKINDRNDKVDILSVIFMFLLNVFKKVVWFALIVVIVLVISMIWMVIVVKAKI